MTRIRVLVDGIAFESPTQIGIWRVFYEVMRRTVKDVDYTLLLAGPPQCPIPDNVRIASAWHRYASQRPTLTDRLSRRMGKLTSGRSWEGSIWHSTFYTLDPRRAGRVVVTLYDMIAERWFYFGGDWAEKQREMKCQAIERADEVVSISQATADEVDRFYPALRKPMTVMPLGCEHLIRTKEGDSVPPATRREIDRPLALYVGGRDSYKNFGVVLEAMAGREWPSDLSLKVAGGPFTQLEKNLMQYLGIDRRIEHLGMPSDSELAHFYRISHCFIFPSLMEGFGLPILEAQMHGALPVISDTKVFHEVAGEGASYFDPRSPSSLSQAVIEAVHGTNRGRWLEAGRENTRRFSWDRAAESVLKVYARLA